MKKIEASVQHVSIFRIGNVYSIGVLFDYESDNQVKSLDIIVQGNNISCWILEAGEPKEARTAMTTATIHIVSASGHIPAFNVNKGNNRVITVPVFAPNALDQLKIAGELNDVSATTRKMLSVVPSTGTGLPAEIITELGLVDADMLSVVRDWGWRGWS